MAKTHSTTYHDARRFILVTLVAAAYCAYAIHSYGLKQGLWVTGLSWSFFIFCTPVADAGFLLAFPIRIIAGVRMFITQVVVWLVGLVIVATAFAANDSAFSKTGLLSLFHKIIVTPWPLGLIIVLSAVGTYVNIRFDDEVYDVAVSRSKTQQLRRERVQLAMMLGFFAGTFVLYAALLHVTNTKISFL